jgi:hypothetical protein
MKSTYDFLKKEAIGHLKSFSGIVRHLHELAHNNEDARQALESLGVSMKSYGFIGPPATDNNLLKTKSSSSFVGPPESKPRNSKVNNSSKPTRLREEMTLTRKGSVTEGHLTMLHSKLTEEGWIDGIEGDFKALFSGKRDEACCLTWLGKYGNGTLVELFRQLVGEGLVIVPKGYSLPYILEGHFKDQNGKWLTRLDKGDKAHDKALPVIQECVDLLKINVGQSLQKLRGEMMEEDEVFHLEYDPFDHQDLNLHKR